MNRVLVDTGPLIAVLSPADRHHFTCTETNRRLDPPLYSCWPVVTEVAWFLRDQPGGVGKLLRMLTTGFLHALSIADTEAEPILHILERYSNLRPQLADAAPVYLAERESIHTIFTLDRRDFSVCRTSRNRAFRLLPELTH